MNRTYVSFDWAIKKLLRDKANFDVLEGFLSELLEIDVKIQEILESEANKQTEFDKYDRVDILVKSDKGELMLIEIQYDSEVDYFHRMVYGMAKLISQYLQEGEPYGKLKRAYSINIIYFDLGEGKDYLYEYRGEFIGISNSEVLMPTSFQQSRFGIKKVSDIFPKYYIVKAKNFKKPKVERSFDEWVYFLQTSEIPDDFNAKGLGQAREKLKYEKMPNLDKQVYQRHIENRRIEMAVKETAEEEGRKKGEEEGRKKGEEEGRKKGEEEGRKKEKEGIAQKMKLLGLPTETIAQTTGLTKEEVDAL